MVIIDQQLSLQLLTGTCVIVPILKAALNAPLKHFMDLEFHYYIMKIILF
jgi:hypothetical protein